MRAGPVTYLGTQVKLAPFQLSRASDGDPPTYIAQHSVQIPSVSFSSPSHHASVKSVTIASFPKSSVHFLSHWDCRGVSNPSQSRRDTAPRYQNDKNDCANQHSHISLSILSRPRLLFTSIQWIHPRPPCSRRMRSHGVKGALAPLRHT